MTVREHLKFYADLKGIPPSLQDKLITEQIEKLCIQKYQNRPAEQLSGGTKRKLQVAIALLGNPEIVLLDEPSAGMDPASRRFMWNIVDSITKNDKKRAVVLTTHAMEEAEFLSSKMGIMVAGGIFRCFGTSQHIKDKFGDGFEIEVRMQEYSDDFLRKYIHDRNLKEGTQSEMLDQLTQDRWIRYDVEVMIENDLCRQANNLKEVIKYYLC